MRTMCGRPGRGGPVSRRAFVRAAGTSLQTANEAAAGVLAAQIRYADGSDPAALDRCMEAVRLRACRFG